MSQQITSSSTRKAAARTPVADVKHRDRRASGNDRYLRDLRALACGAFEERGRRQPGLVAEHGAQVRGGGGGGGDGAGRPGGEPGGVGAAGARVVPGAGGYPAAAGDVAGDRGAPRLHRRAAGGGGDGGHDPSAAAG